MNNNTAFELEAHKLMLNAMQGINACICNTIICNTIMYFAWHSSKAKAYGYGIAPALIAGRQICDHFTDLLLP